MEKGTLNTHTRRIGNTGMNDIEYIQYLEAYIIELKEELKKERGDNAKFVNDLLTRQKQTFGEVLGKMLKNMSD